jgi:PAS domain S-box-containing protein
MRDTDVGDQGATTVTTLLRDDEREQSVVISDPSLPDNPLIFVSEEFERQTGYTADEVIGRNCRFLQGPDTDPAAIQAIRDALDAHTEITVDLLNYRKDGQPYWNRLRLRPLRDEAGTIRYYVGAQNPIPADQVLPRPVEALFD